MGGSSKAATLLYEPFSYAAGATLPGKGPDGVHTWAQAFNNATVLDDAAVVTPGLTSPAGFPESQGNLVQFGQTGSSYRIGFGGSGNPSGFTSGTVYYSQLLKITDLNFGNGTATLAVTGTTPNPGRQISALNNGVGASASSNLSVNFAPLWGRIDPVATSTAANQRYNIGISKGNGTASRVFDSRNFGPNDTLLVVAAYTFPNGTTTTEGVGSLWINPDMSTFGSATAPTPDVTSLLGTADGNPTGTLQSFGLYQNSTLSTATFGNTGVNLDEARVGTTWADVVPEPTTLSILTLGATAFIRRRRKV